MHDIYIILGLFLAFCVILKLLLPRLKGAMGESAVKIKLNSLDKEKYRIINNLVLENKQGNTKTTQIDHLVVSRYGIFSVETKNYKGWIYGSEHAKKWTQNIYGNKTNLMNPILQNYAHIKAVESIIKDSYPDMRYFSIVAEIKFEVKNSVVCKISQVAKNIEELSSTEIINETDVDSILKLIEENKLNISNREHVKNLKEIKK